MSHLLDVNMAAACAWQSHEHHCEATRWLQSLASFATCPAVQRGFLRVSMSPGYGASFPDARQAQAEIVALSAHQWVSDDVSASDLPILVSRHHITDAHLVALARRQRLLRATLDEPLCREPWAVGIAIHPLRMV